MVNCASLCRSLYLTSRSLLLPSSSKGQIPFTCITTRNYREIQGSKEGNITTIKGTMHIEKDRQIAPKHIEEDNCPLRSRGIKITYEDVLILQQFITSTGEILLQRETGLCDREYFKVISCVKMAQRANLLPGGENGQLTTPNGKIKLNCYLTRYPIGTRRPILGRGLPYRRLYYKVGDARVVRDAPHVSNSRMREHQ